MQTEAPTDSNAIRTNTPSAMKHTHLSSPDRAALPTVVFAPYRERWGQRRNKGDDQIVAKNASTECIGGFLKEKNDL